MIGIEDIKEGKVPRHIAVIMDGNGRWAKKQGMARIFGHRNALTSIRETVQAASDIGVEAITMYAFSTENWKRPKLEVEGLMTLLVKTLKKELPEFQRKNTCVRAIGNLKNLPQNAQDTLNHIIEETKNNTDIVLTFALSYGSRQEIVNCTQELVKKALANEISPEDITEETIQQHMYDATLPDVDLMIRTSGEQRISNYLLWQMAYAELYFTNILWPDFRREDLFNAVLSFQGRERRFGQTSEQL